MTSALTTRNEQPHDDALRRRIMLVASVAAVLALLHFADHAIRGELVVGRELDPEWNHSGWPFDSQTDKPYLFPLYFAVVNALLIGGIFGTLRRRLWAGYWLATSVALIALLLFVHFVTTPRTVAETPRVIALSYDNDLAGALALIDLFGLIAVLAALALLAVRTRRRSGRW